MLNPTEYITSKFKDHDVVLLGERHAVKDTLEAVMEMIPSLYEAGVLNLGMEFGCYEDQALLDQLVTAPIYDEKLARDLMFHYNVRWPYKEYTDLYRATWKFNQTLKDDQPKFRVLSLSYAYNWREFNGVRTPESSKKIFYKGNTEVFRFQVIENEVLNKNEKILVLTGTPHAFTRYKIPHYSFNEDDFVRFDGNFLGNRLYDKYGNRIYTIVVHQWFYDPTTLKDNYSPAHGTLELWMGELGNKPVGFDLLGTKYGQLSDHSSYSFGYKNFKLEDFFDGYLFLKPLNQIHGATIDYDFLVGRSFDDVILDFPDRDWDLPPTNEEEYWKIVEKYVAF